MPPYDPPDSLADVLAGAALIAVLCIAAFTLRWLMFDAPPGDYGPIPSAYAEP